MLERKLELARQKQEAKKRQQEEKEKKQGTISPFFSSFIILHLPYLLLYSFTYSAPSLYLWISYITPAPPAIDIWTRIEMAGNGTLPPAPQPKPTVESKSEASISVKKPTSIAKKLLARKILLSKLQQNAKSGKIAKPPAKKPKMEIVLDEEEELEE
jgi:hypothetical protein